MNTIRLISWFTAALALVPSLGQAQPTLIATGSLTESRAGANADLSSLTYSLENQAPANLLGGLGSAITYDSGKKFVLLPDRGPNAVTFDALIDNTVSYVNRFHTVQMELNANPAGPLPFTLTARLQNTTLLWSSDPLVYGTGAGLGVGSGVPPINDVHHHYFSGRSDNFDPAGNSGNPNNARFDTEGVRVSADGQSVFISDEYGPYVYQFDRSSGARLRSYTLPEKFYVTNQSPVGNDEITGNTTGRTANKGMEGLAITPDGNTLVGIMQAALLQDAAQGGAAANLLRIVTIDVASGATHEYAYLLTTGSGVSEILAINSHEFLVDERDGRGLEGGSNGTSNDARVKQLFRIDLDGAVDVSNEDGLTAATHAVNKTLFLDLVAALTGNGIAANRIPAKIEGIAFGPDVRVDNHTRLHTLWVSNDNDFLLQTADVPAVPNPNQFFVFGFTDDDLPNYVPPTHGLPFGN
ncbi:MAG TPA: esterase-like activity of phytase family protein [Candidatus Udaeobacter sp.]|nr:esterase-like activity of phytase family protein [Candidatus Udaeobacter sp.]